MPIIQAGKQFTESDVKEFAGNNVSMIRDLLQQAEQFREFLAATPDADLIDFGLTQDEVNIIKGAFIGELPQLRALFNSTTWAKRLLGIGV
jgi:hypothetical protein